MLKAEDLKGIIPPIITPIDKEENVDIVALRRVVNHVIDGGVHGVFPLGSNGEFYALDKINKRKAIETVVEETNGRVPVMAGATAITTKEAIALAKDAEAAGADCISVLSPMFIQPNEEEMYYHFSKIAESVNLPVVLYNNPGKTTNTLSLNLIKRLSDVDNIIGIKGTSVDFTQTMLVINETNKNNNFSVLSGTDYYIYGTLCYGGVGAVAGTANVAPRLVSDIYDKYIAGDYAGSLEAQNKLIPLRNTYSYGSFPVIMKTCMNILGLEVGNPAKPIVHPPKEKIKEIEIILNDMGLLK